MSPGEPPAARPIHSSASRAGHLWSSHARGPSGEPWVAHPEAQTHTPQGESHGWPPSEEAPKRDRATRADQRRHAKGMKNARREEQREMGQKPTVARDLCEAFLAMSGPVLTKPAAGGTNLQLVQEVCVLRPQLQRVKARE